MTPEQNQKVNNILDLIRISPLPEKICLIIANIGACIVPFALLAAIGNGSIWWAIGSWGGAALAMIVFKFLKQHRTKEKVTIGFMPSIKFNHK